MGDEEIIGKIDDEWDGYDKVEVAVEAAQAQLQHDKDTIKKLWTPGDPIK